MDPLPLPGFSSQPALQGTVPLREEGGLQDSRHILNLCQVQPAKEALDGREVLVRRFGGLGGVVGVDGFFREAEMLIRFWADPCRSSSFSGSCYF